jgi:hypothetical protein
MNRVRKGLLGVAAAVLTVGATAGTTLASSAPAAASSGGCKVEMESLTAEVLWHDGGTDWVWFVIDGKYYPGNTKSVPFLNGTTQVAYAFGYPSKTFYGGRATLQLVLDRTWPTPNLVIDSATVNCDKTGRTTLEFSNGQAIYELDYIVEDA